MSGFKNFVILILSAIILVQSVLLVYFMRRQSARPKITRPISRMTPSQEKPVQAKAVSEETAKQPILSLPAPQPVVIRGKIALVLDDWGYNLKNRDFITDNDFHVTLSILPFKAFSTQIAHAASQNKKDVIIHMPMEPHNKESYGLEDNTLLTTMNQTTVIRLLDAAFDSVPSAKGLSNHMGSKATEDSRLMKIVLGALKNKGMFFFDSVVTPRSVTKKIAANIGAPFVERDVFLDNESAPSYIRAQLLKLAERAERSGVAIGVGHDRVNTVAVLREEIPRLQADGYKFVNLSEIVGE